MLSSPGYVNRVGSQVGSEEYKEMKRQRKVTFDYPMDGEDDRDDDDGDSSRDDADGEDEDDEDEEEEEEHLALADSTIVIPVDEPIFPPEGTEPVIPPPSTDITIGARRALNRCTAPLASHIPSPHYHHWVYPPNPDISTVDAEERRHGIIDVGTVIRDTW
ncbi:hypothetical protein Tco_0942290 [Tanacetum coccineum]